MPSEYALILIHDNKSADPDLGGPFYHWILAMPTPPGVIYDQTQQPDSDRLELCGESCIATALTALGMPVTPHDIAQEIRASGGEQSVQNGTDWAHLAPCLTRRGVGTADISGLGALPPTLHHAGGTTCANPWGGRWITYADGQLGPAWVEAHGIVATGTATTDDLLVLAG